MSKIRPVFKCHGGKFYLKEWIVDQLPSKYTSSTFIEGCCGGCSVILNKERSTNEIVNDADPNIIAIIKELVGNSLEFIQSAKEIEYTKENFEWSKNTNGALAELVRRRFSRGGLGKSFAWSERLRGGQPGDVNAWETFKHELIRIADRLKDVKVYCMPVTELFDKFDGDDVTWYMDPPYLPITRQARNTYSIEMTEKDHIELGEKLNKAKGKVLLSGYQSALYAKVYKGWNMVCRPIANHSSQSKNKEKRIEVLWRNY